jgi:hypothetical protein
MALRAIDPNTNQPFPTGDAGNPLGALGGFLSGGAITPSLPLNLTSNAVSGTGDVSVNTGAGSLGGIANQMINLIIIVILGFLVITIVKGVLSL